MSIDENKPFFSEENKCYIPINIFPKSKNIYIFNNIIYIINPYNHNCKKILDINDIFNLDFDITNDEITFLISYLEKNNIKNIELSS